jgi:hypothetical protein
MKPCTKCKIVNTTKPVCSKCEVNNQNNKVYLGLFIAALTLLCIIGWGIILLSN